MRVLRAQFPRDIFELWGIDFQNMLEGMNQVEIMEIYQYDNQSLLSKARLTFDKEITLPDSELSDFFKKKFLANYFYLIERNKNEIIAILNQKRSQTMNIFKEYVWAIIPPVWINKEYVILSLLISETDMSTLMDRMAENIEFKVLSNTKIEDFKGGFGFNGFSVPNLTKRQMEIINYAIKKGYYDTPRKISAKQLAKDLNIEYSTFYEHVRKIEKKIIKHTFGNAQNLPVVP